MAGLSTVVTLALLPRKPSPDIVGTVLGGCPRKLWTVTLLSETNSSRSASVKTTPCRAGVTDTMPD